MKVKITAKRQATFPAALCRDLGLKPGDTIDLEAHSDEGRKYWVLRRSGETDRPWLGTLKGYATAAAVPEDAPIVSGLASPEAVSGGLGMRSGGNGSSLLGSSMLRWGAAR